MVLLVVMMVSSPMVMVHMVMMVCGVLGGVCCALRIVHCEMCAVRRDDE